MAMQFHHYSEKNKEHRQSLNNSIMNIISLKYNHIRLNMGIQGLLQHVKSAKETTSIATFKGKTILVDASIYMRAYLHSGDGSLKSILTRLNDQVTLLMNNDIAPVYIFDGSGCSKVKIVIAKRAKLHRGIEIKINELHNEIVQRGEQQLIEPAEDTNVIHLDLVKIAEAKIQTLEAANRFLTREIINECKELLDEKGVKWIQATGEADTLIAHMFSHLNDIAISADAVLSTDGDMLTYGCPILITELSNSATIYKLDKVLEHLQMTREMFVDFCILCGCDYSCKITGIAKKKANDLVIKYNNIEAILAHIQNDEKLRVRHTHRPEFIERYQIARNMFLLHSPDGVATKLYL